MLACWKFAADWNARRTRKQLQPCTRILSQIPPNRFWRNRRAALHGRWTLCCEERLAGSCAGAGREAKHLLLFLTERLRDKEFSRDWVCCQKVSINEFFVRKYYGTELGTARRGTWNRFNKITGLQHNTYLSPHTEYHQGRQGWLNAMTRTPSKQSSQTRPGQARLVIMDCLNW